MTQLSTLTWHHSRSTRSALPALTNRRESLMRPHSIINQQSSFINLFLDLAARAGHLLRTISSPFHLTNGCGSTGPCSCTWPDGLPATYTVSGLGSLSPCPSCDASTDPPWDGVFHHTGAGCIWWAADAAFDPRSINGDMLDITYTQILLRTTTTPCRWEMYIACTSVINPTATMWSGYKTWAPGSTPAGTYSLVSSDCGNTTPTLTVT